MLRRISTIYKEDRQNEHANANFVRRKTTTGNQENQQQIIQNPKYWRRKTTDCKEAQQLIDFSLPRRFELDQTNKINSLSNEHVHNTNTLESAQLPPIQVNVKNKQSDKYRRTSSLILNPKLLFSRSKSIRDLKLGNKTNKLAEAIGLRRAHILKLQKVFNIIDVDCSKSIFIDEFFELLNESRTSYTDKLFKFLGIDVRKNTLKFHEFVIICAFYCMLTKEGILQFCFEIFDKNKEGTLDVKKFQVFVKAVNESSSAVMKGVSKKAFYVCDKNMDGFLDIGEFMSLESRFPFLMFPLFRLQEQMQEKTLGESTWNKLHVEFDSNLKKKNKNYSTSHTNVITLYSILKHQLDK